MTADDRVLRHLRAKGKVAVMTKAASFLLWYDDFGQVRDYLLKNIAWMISDASGIPPSYADPAGFEQVTYGDFAGPYFVIDNKNTRAEFVKMWKKQPHRDLPFRFGYPDSDKHNHMMITRPKPLGVRLPPRSEGRARRTVAARSSSSPMPRSKALSPRCPRPSATSPATLSGVAPPRADRRPHGDARDPRRQSRGALERSRRADRCRPAESARSRTSCARAAALLAIGRAPATSASISSARRRPSSTSRRRS